MLQRISSSGAPGCRRCRCWRYRCTPAPRLACRMASSASSMLSRLGSCRLYCSTKKLRASCTSSNEASRDTPSRLRCGQEMVCGGWAGGAHKGVALPAGSGLWATTIVLSQACQPFEDCLIPCQCFTNPSGGRSAAPPHPPTHPHLSPHLPPTRTPHTTIHPPPSPTPSTLTCKPHSPLPTSLVNKPNPPTLTCKGPAP